MGLRRQVGGGDSERSSTSSSPEGSDLQGLYHPHHHKGPPGIGQGEGDDDGDDAIVALFDKPEGWGTRHTMAIMGFLGFAASYAMRVMI